MNVSIHFPAEVENTLRRRAAAAGQDIETFVRMVITETLAADESSPARRAGSHAEFMAKLQAISERHPGSQGHMDDSRESIYAGRGE